MPMISIKNKTKKNSGVARLNLEDREFFSRLTESMYLNPFSEELELILKLIPTYTPEQFRSEHFLWTMNPLLNQRIEQLESKGISKIQQLQGKDRTLLENAFLLQAYLWVVPEMDKLVQNQLIHEGSSVDVPFGRPAVDKIKARGFSEQQGVDFFALFYQLRRAYYFISHSLTGDSPSMQKLRLSLWNNVFSYDIRTYDQFLVNRMEDFSTLLLGATGAGKGSAAAAIGRSGHIPFDLKKGRFTKSFNDIFVSMNLSQFSESLIESELFGHCKGHLPGPWKTTRVYSNDAQLTGRCFWMKSATWQFPYKSNYSRSCRSESSILSAVTVKSALRDVSLPPPTVPSMTSENRVTSAMIFFTDYALM